MMIGMSHPDRIASVTSATGLLNALSEVGHDGGVHGASPCQDSHSEVGLAFA